VLARQSQGRIGLLDLHTIAKGADHCRKILEQLRASRYTALIADAVFEQDLETLGELALEGKLSTGASGLGLGLARAFIRTGRVTRASSDFSEAMRPVGGRGAVVAGSCSAATLEQIAVAAQTMPIRRLDPDRLVNDPAEVAAAISWAADHMPHGPVVIAASADPQTVARVQSKYGREASGHAIEAASATIVEALIAQGARRLVLAGGETSGAAVDRLNIPAFLIGPEIAPGVPVLRSLGNRQGDLLMALKSGNFGGPDFFAKALAIMQ
jgi:uncharacterized protein YgbK (DUF1537 family)